MIGGDQVCDRGFLRSDPPAQAEAQSPAAATKRFGQLDFPRCSVTRATPGSRPIPQRSPMESPSKDFLSGESGPGPHFRHHSLRTGRVQWRLVRSARPGLLTRVEVRRSLLRANEAP